jgi:subtilase family protein
MILDRRACATGLLLLMTGITLTVTMARAARQDLKPSDVVVIRSGPARPGRALSERLASIDAAILEEYDTFALVSLGPGARRALEGEGLEIEEIPDRTRAGRGAYHFDTRLGEPRFPDELRADPLNDPAYNVYIVQFIGPVKASWLETLRGAGAEVLMYLPSYSYVTAIEGRDVERVEKLGFVQWVGVYHPAYKLDPGLHETGEASQAISFSLFPGRDSKRAESIVSASGGALMKGGMLAGQQWFGTTVERSAVLDLARLPEVSSIEKFVPPSLVNDQATWVTQSNIPDTRSVHSHGLHGEGQLVTMADEGINTQHPMFHDPNNSPLGQYHRKIQACNLVPNCAGSPCNYTSGVGGHGTHVAGIIAGDAPETDGVTYRTYNGHDGHAFLSRLIVQDLGPQAQCLDRPQDPSLIISSLFQPSYNMNSRIHSNSWGSQGMLPYCSGAIGSDQFMWDNPDFLIIFAAGNENSIGLRCQATAKDMITVGATLNGTLADQRWSHSSRGPVGTDGRRKPTLMAPGVAVCSARDPAVPAFFQCSTPPSTTDYTLDSGTSMAAPAVAGEATLTRQYFMEGWYPSGTPTAAQALNPSASLLKAVLVNSAEEMLGVGAHSDSTVKIINESLQLTKGQNSIDPASAVSSHIGLDYGRTYDLNMSFLVTGSSLGLMTIADDGRFRAQVVPATSGKFALQIQGGDRTGQVTLRRGVWDLLTVSYNPSLGTFHATVKFYDPSQKEWITFDLGTFTFRSSPVDQVTVGADDSGGAYGQIKVDDMCYTGSLTWCDYFSDLSHWTITPVTDETAYPNNLQGWGRIKLDNALYFSGDSRHLLACDDRAGLRTGQQRVTKVQVTDTSQPLKATLVWSDRPGTDPQHAITNNLDLVVRSPSNVVYNGNCFQGRPGQSAPAPACPADSVNVEENVLRLSSVESGVWTIEVDAQNVDPSGGDKPQPFALAVTGGIVVPTQTATADYQIGPGTVTQGTYQSTFTSDDVREGFQETLSGGVYSLTQIWRFGNLSCPPFLLHLEGYRPGNTSNDTFQFAWAPEVNGAPGTFQDIPSALISLPFERTGGADFPFLAPDLSGSVYIRVKDTGTGAAQTTLYIDYLTVR